MLYEAEQMSQLATYINDMQDPELLRWWGKYNESLGQLDTALQSYRQADDTVAIVRLHCQQEDFVAACNVVENSSNAAAAFMLARQLEATDQVCSPWHTAWMLPGATCLPSLDPVLLPMMLTMWVCFKLRRRYEVYEELHRLACAPHLRPTPPSLSLAL